MIERKAEIARGAAVTRARGFAEWRPQRARGRFAKAFQSNTIARLWVRIYSKRIEHGRTIPQYNMDREHRLRWIPCRI